MAGDMGIFRTVEPLNPQREARASEALPATHGGTWLGCGAARDMFLESLKFNMCICIWICTFTYTFRMYIYIYVYVYGPSLYYIAFFCCCQLQLFCRHFTLRWRGVARTVAAKPSAERVPGGVARCHHRCCVERNAVSLGVKSYENPRVVIS